MPYHEGIQCAGDCRLTSSNEDMPESPSSSPRIRMRHLPVRCQFPHNIRLAEVLPVAPSGARRAVDGDGGARTIGCADLSNDAPL